MSRTKISSRIAFEYSSLDASDGAQRLIPPSSVMLSDIAVCGLATGTGAWRWLCGMSVAAVSSFRCGRGERDGVEESSSTVWKLGGAVLGMPVK